MDDKKRLVGDSTSWKSRPDRNMEWCKEEVSNRLYSPLDTGIHVNRFRQPRCFLPSETFWPLISRFPGGASSKFYEELLCTATGFARQPSSTSGIFESPLFYSRAVSVISERPISDPVHWSISCPKRPNKMALYYSIFDKHCI